MISKNIVVRVDANQEIGTGHAVRTASILEYISEKDKVVVVGNGRALPAFFPTAEIVQSEIGDEEPFKGVVKKTAPELIIVDHSSPTQDLWKAARESKGGKVVAIDDPGGQIDADLIVNGTILEQYHQYSGQAENCTVLAGGDYAILRPEFAEIRWQRPQEKSLTIIVGSGSRAVEWLFLLLSDSVNRASWGDITAVVGKAFVEMERLQRICESIDVDFVSGCSGKEIAHLMAKSSAVLITGGMVVYEAMAIGVPAAVFPQVGMQEAEWLSNKGCIINLGYDDGLNPKNIETAVNKLIADDIYSSEMSVRQRKTIDGQGIFRVADAINALTRPDCK